MKKRYKIFAILYTAFTIYCFVRAKQDESITIGVMFMLVLFWIVGGIAFKLMLHFDKSKSFKKKDYILLSFCTPFPSWVFLFIISIPYLYNDLLAKTFGKTKYYENISGKRKEIIFKHWNGVDKEIQNYKLDSNLHWIKEGTWWYFDNLGHGREEIYRNDSLIKSIG